MEGKALLEQRRERRGRGEEGRNKYTISIWWRLLSNLCKTRCERFGRKRATKNKKTNIQSSSRVIKKFQAVEFVLI